MPFSKPRFQAVAQDAGRLQNRCRAVHRGWCARQIEPIVPTRSDRQRESVLEKRARAVRFSNISNLPYGVCVVAQAAS